MKGVGSRGLGSGHPASPFGDASATGGRQDLLPASHPTGAEMPRARLLGPLQLGLCTWLGTANGKRPPPTLTRTQRCQDAGVASVHFSGGAAAGSAPACPWQGAWWCRQLMLHSVLRGSGRGALGTGPLGAARFSQRCSRFVCVAGERAEARALPCGGLMEGM